MICQSKHFGFQYPSQFFYQRLIFSHFTLSVFSINSNWRKKFKFFFLQAYISRRLGWYRAIFLHFDIKSKKYLPATSPFPAVITCRTTDWKICNQINLTARGNLSFCPTLNHRQILFALFLFNLRIFVKR